ncbi:MAG: hypothetical protein U5K51_14990 [Flavobacteriaceae bacterium]|nr:hypothetical protein [Flavobacteriaceae bacterium]
MAEQEGAGKKGISYRDYYSKGKEYWEPIEKSIKKQFQYKPVPNGKDVCENQLYSLIEIGA